MKPGRKVYFGILLLTAAPCLADVPAPEEGTGAAREHTILTVPHLLGAQIKPLGAMYETAPHHRFMFFGPSSHILLREAFFGLGATLAVSPSFFYYGPSVTLAPLTIFRVSVEFYHVLMGIGHTKYGVLDYGALGQLGDTTYSFRSNNGAQLGHRDYRGIAVHIRPSIRLKYWRVVLLYNAKIMHYRPDDFEGVFYNYLVGVVTSHRSWAFTHDTILLFEITQLEEDKHAARLGINSNMVHVFADSENGLENALQWRIGPMLAWTVRREILGGAVQDPTILVIMHFYARDIIADRDKQRLIGGAIGVTFNTDWRRTVEK